MDASIFNKEDVDIDPILDFQYPFKIPFNIVPHIIVSFRAHAFFHFGDVECHIEDSLITTIGTHLRVFEVQNVQFFNYTNRF